MLSKRCPRKSQRKCLSKWPIELGLYYVTKVKCQIYNNHCERRSRFVHANAHFWYLGFSKIPHLPYSTILTSKPKYKVPHCQWARFKYPIARTVLNDIIDIKGACPTYSMWFDFEIFSNILQMIKHNSLFILQFFLILSILTSIWLWQLKKYHQ